MPATANFHSKRNARYSMMPTTVMVSAMAPSVASSAPTDGPTTSVRDSLTGSTP